MLCDKALAPSFDFMARLGQAPSGVNCSFTRVEMEEGRSHSHQLSLMSRATDVAMIARFGATASHVVAGGQAFLLTFSASMTPISARVRASERPFIHQETRRAVAVAGPKSRAHTEIERKTLPPETHPLESRFFVVVELVSTPFSSLDDDVPSPDSGTNMSRSIDTAVPYFPLFASPV